MKIEVVIPNYNGYELVEQNLPVVIDSLEDYKEAAITIVDDGSQKEEQRKLELLVEKINKKSPVKVNLLLYQENKGFSSNVNRAALASTADIIVLLNTDVAPHKDFLQYLLPHFKDKEMFGVGCMDESIEDKTVLRGRGIGEWRKGFLVHHKGEVDKTDTFWVSGGSSAFNREMFQKLGGLDTLYDPFYWEDIDLSYRARKAGYKVLFEPKSIVVHIHKKGSIKKHYRDDVIQSYAMRNQFTFVWKNITDGNLIFSHIFWLPYYLLSALSRFDKIFLKGFLLALMRLPQILNHRNKQKTYYKKTDKELI
ncbi:MAG: glycosyltransferase family 2 protein [Candidatus Levyibacteriota bacterium]